MSNRLVIGGLDQNPDQFNFIDRNLADPSTVYVASVNPVGFDSSAWSVVGGEGSTDNTNWSTSGSIVNGQMFYVRGTSSSNFEEAVEIDVLIGEVSDTFVITTRSPDTSPNPFDFQDFVDTTPSTEYTSNTIIVSGLEPNYPVYISADGGFVDAGTSSLSGTFTQNTTVYANNTGKIFVAARTTSSEYYSNTVNDIITIDGVSGIFSVTTSSLVGEASFTTPGTYYWTCPSGVSSVCVFCVGGGGGGGAGYYAGGGGGGGGAAWKNNISVTPGQSYLVVVGNGGISYTATQGISGLSGGQSYFIGPATVRGSGGAGGSWGVGDASGSFPGGSGGTYFGDGGGYGGRGGDSNNDLAGGGGGTGGYISTGGAGGNANTSVNGQNGNGGGGGGGNYGGSNSSAGAAPSGGGVGLFGIGSSGTGGNPGTGGSGGTDGSSDLTVGGSSNRGGSYGGGGGGQSNNAKNTPGCYGGAGAVRIFWGSGRSFPYVAT